MKKIVSPMATGNGAFIAHRLLESRIMGYRTVPYDPWVTLCPPLLMKFSRLSADVWHTTPDYAGFVAPVSRPLVVSFQNYVLDGFMGAYSSRLQRIHYATDLRWFTQWALRRASVVTAVSAATAELLRSDLGFRGDVRLIHNAVDCDMFHPPDQRNNALQIRVLFSGNLTSRKGAQWLSQIAVRLNPNVKIFCASGLRGQEKEGAFGGVSFLGKVPFSEMPSLYREFDVLLMPTVREGLSLAALEALASGMPIVATDASSMPEIVVHGSGGWLCPIGDVDKFAEALNALAAEPAMRAEFGAFNRARALRLFQVEDMVSAYRKIFDTL